jgi:hypothetical protein
VQEFGATQKTVAVRVAEEAASLAAHPLEHEFVKVRSAASRACGSAQLILHRETNGKGPQKQGTMVAALGWT